MAEAFDPDAYLKSTSSFDPDAFLLGSDSQSQTQIQTLANNPDVPGGGQVSTAAPTERSFLDKAEGVAETALTSLTGATTGALGYGIGTVQDAYDKLTGGEDRNLRGQYADALTNTPESEAGQEYVKAIGDTLGVLPPVLGTPAATGLRGVSRVEQINRQPEAKQLKSFVSQGFEPKEFKWNKGFSDAEKQAQLNQALASGDKQRLSAMIDADPEFFKALDTLGAKEKGIPSASSRNRQYQETEQALKKIPGSDLSKKEFDQVSELQVIADDLITEFGGKTDKSEISMDLLSDSQKAIGDLEKTAEAAYDNIKQNIPKQTMTPMNNIGQAMKQELDDLGGDVSQLSTLEKKLLSMSENGATYHAVDKIRKEVGGTIGKKSDKYKSEDTGALKRIYAKLTEDQEVVANDLGMGEQWQGAKELVKQRKDLEDNSIVMFGKNLSDAFMPKMGSAVKKLADGDYKKFNELINSVPKNKRQEVIVSALNDALTMGSRKEKQLSLNGYADWHNGLNKNPRLKKRIYNELPQGLGKKLDAMGRVTNGIRSAQTAAPVGGQVMANRKVFDRVVNGVASRFLTKLPGVIGDLATVGLEKGKSKDFDAAIAVLGDPDFVANINALAKGQNKKAEALEKKLMNKKTFRDYAATLSPREAKQLSVLGLISWLGRSNEEQDDASTP
jgi:hypothetical protein